MKRLVVFLSLVFVITYAIEFWMIFNGGLQSEYAKGLLTLIMLIPAVCVILTRLITKEGFKNLYLKPNFIGHGKYYVLAWLMPAILTVIGGIIYFLIFPNMFDVNMTVINDALTQQYTQAGLDIAQMPSINTIIFMQVVIAVVLGPLMNLIPALGEELGWRGYLLPKLNEKMKTICAVLLTGVIWGLWHAPIIYMGHNYGTEYFGYPYLGILGMIVFCVAVGMFFGYLSLKTKSAIPSALAHGGLNAFVATPILFATVGTNPLIGPMPVGIIGGAGFIIVAIIISIAIIKQDKNKMENVELVQE